MAEAEADPTDSARLQRTTLIQLSVSGTPFTVRGEMLTENEWILSKIVEEDTIPWGILDDGKYYIDQDPIAFRWVLHYARVKSLPSEIAKSLTELESIKSLAEYLCFGPLSEYVDGRIEECEKVKTKVEELEEQIVKLQKLHNTVKGLDGIKFIKHKEKTEACKVVALWSSSDCDIVRSMIRCPSCGEGVGQHHCENIIGQRTDTAINAVKAIRDIPL